MIEVFNPKYKNIVSIADHSARWERILKLENEDHASFRVLFTIETFATLEWREPTPKRLNELLDFKLKNGHLAVKWSDIINLIQAVWPLQLAKREVQKMCLIWGSGDWKKYPFGTIALPIIGCITTWWALETLINDISGILLTQRRDTVTERERLLIEEKNPKIRKDGQIFEKTVFQPIEDRIGFIFRWATGNTLDKSGELWKKIIDLKKARNITIHGIGKSEPEEVNLTELHKTVKEGLVSVSQLLERIFIETPEFGQRHSYHYLAFWGCKVQDPIIWDGQEGNIYLGITHPQRACILNALAPEPATVVEPE